MLRVCVTQQTKAGCAHRGDVGEIRDGDQLQQRQK